METTPTKKLSYEDNAKKMQDDYVNRFFKDGMDEQYKKRLQETARDIDSHSRQLGQDIETYNKKFNDNAKKWWGKSNKNYNEPDNALDFEVNAQKLQDDFVNSHFKEGMSESYKKQLKDMAKELDGRSRSMSWGGNINDYTNRFNGQKDYFTKLLQQNRKDMPEQFNDEFSNNYASFYEDKQKLSPKVEEVKPTQSEWKPESQSSQEKKSFIESPIVYEGGKGRYLSQIKPYFPKDRVKKSYDAFSGGLNVALNMDADEVVANELDKNIYGIQNELKNTKAPEMVNYLKDTINKYGLRDVNNFNKFVENWNKSPNKNYKDLYLIKSLMKGGRLQFDKNGNIIYKDEANGNVYPRYDRAKGQTWLNKSSGDLRNKLINLRKSNITLSNDDAMNVIDKAQKGEFVYCDPPYSNTKAAYNDNWTIRDDYRLFKSLDNATRKGVKWAMSNVLDNNEHIEQWARENGYHIYPIRTNYHGKIYNEVLITNYDE